MAATPPPSYTPPPAEEPQRGIKDTFSNLMDDFVTWVTEKLPSDAAALAANAYTNALAAFSSAGAAATSESNAATSASNAATSAINSADSATAAAVTAGAALWVSGQTVQRDAAVISPADRRTYRRKTAAGASTTDPSIDPTNYVLLSADASSYILLGSATVSTPTPLINFLNLFTDTYSKYVVEIEGLACAESARTLKMRLAVAGVANSEALYYGGQTPSTEIGGTGLSPTGAAFTVSIRGARSNRLKSVGIHGASRAGTVFVNPTEYCFDKSSVVSGFQLYLESSANFTSGTIRVYGVRA